MKKLIGLSLFSGAGIGETYFLKSGIDIKVANELLKKRADLYSLCHKNTNVVVGDITKKEIFNKVLKECNKYKIDFILASPPCQGMSIVGKNRTNSTMLKDSRNFLFYKVIDFINVLKPSYVLIENVPTLLRMEVPFKNKLMTIPQVIKSSIPNNYVLEENIFDSADYGVPQHRKRAIIKIYKKGLVWKNPSKVKKYVTVKEAIGYLPSLEAGEKSDISYHYARPHIKANIEVMKHTPTGCTAFDNKKYYPKQKDGSMTKGYKSSYRRIKWDEPSPTITIRNDCISSQRNVHPGRKLKNGTYSDARVLTPLELMILTSLPKNWLPKPDVDELLIRQCIGESIPPLLLEKIVKGIKR